MRFGGLLFLLYLAVGALVAAGIIGNDDYFAGADTAEEIAEAVLAVLLWPLVLLGVEMSLGADGGDSGRDRPEKPQGDNGGKSGAGK